MTSVCVLTALYGDKDRLREPAWQSVPAKFVAVTDRQRPAPGWDLVIEPRPAMDDALASRLPKCRPELYTDAEVVVWIDAQFEVVGNELLAELVDRLGDGDYTAFRHPWLSWADEVESARRGGSDALVSQARQLTPPVGHWAAGVSARRMTADVAAFGRDWWDALCRSGVARDQIACSALLGAHRVTVASLDGSYRRHPGLVLHDHYWGPVRQRWEDLKARIGWRCPLCHAANLNDHCVNSWIDDGRRRGCKGERHA